MQPKIPRLPVWSRHTNYIGALGLHSENSPTSRARQKSVTKELDKVVSVLRDMERKGIKEIERSKKEIQNSMLAYTEKVKKIKAKKRQSFLDDAESVDFSPKGGSPHQRSRGSSGSEELKIHRTVVSPIKSRRISLPKIPSSNNKTFRERRLSSVSDSAAMSSSKPTGLLSSRSTPPKSQETTVFQVNDNEQIIISPFPYESYIVSAASSNITIPESPKDTKEVPKRRISYRQYREEKEQERQRIQQRKKANASEYDPTDHTKDILREQARNRRAALEMERLKEEAMKNKKDVLNTFCYSTAVEELLKKSDPKSYVATDKDFISKVEVDQNGYIKQTFGPGVLSIIGVDEHNNILGMRIKWSARLRPQVPHKNEDDNNMILPPIKVGHRPSTSSEDNEQSGLDKINTQLSLTAKKKRKRKNKRKKSLIVKNSIKRL